MFAVSVDQGVTWPTIVTVEGGVLGQGVGQYVSIAGTGTTLYISYYDFLNTDLKAAKSVDSGASWVVY